jgi:hypothetical protein
MVPESECKMPILIGSTAVAVIADVNGFASPSLFDLSDKNPPTLASPSNVRAPTASTFRRANEFPFAF